MKLKLNVEELRREIMEGTKAVPLVSNERSEQVSRGVRRVGVGGETPATDEEAGVEGRMVREVSLEVSLEMGMLGFVRSV